MNAIPPRLVPVTAFALLVTLPLIAEDEAATFDTAAPLKDHTLFVGLKCRVTQDGIAYSVRNVVRSRVMLESNGAAALVSVHNLQGVDVRPEMVVGTTRMRIDNLRHERAYSIQADPQIEAQRAQQAMGEAASMRLDAASVESAVGVPFFDRGAISQTVGGAQVLAAIEARESAIQEQLGRSASDHFINRARDPSSFQDMVTKDDQHDILLISFEASAPTVILDAYAITLTEYVTPDRPNEPKIALRFSDLRSIGTKPRRVTIRLIDFPRGFRVNDVQVHIFSRGREIPSNLSEKPTDLSREEALLFLRMAHLNSSKAGDLPPALVRELIPPSLVLPGSVDLSGQTVTLFLDENGVPESIPDTLTDGRPLDDGFKSLLGQLCFHPALDKGTPVASTVEFPLADIFK